MLHLFKKNRVKQFNYMPRYFNERKEKMDKVFDKKINYTKSELTNLWRGRHKASSDKNSSIRLLIIIAILTFFSYLIIIA